MYEDLNQRIEKLIEPFFGELGLVLVELKIHQTRGKTAIEIFADRPAGGISIAECTQLNKKIGHEIEAQEIFNERYTIEVSSPGLDRSLKTSQDFTRMIHKEVRFFLGEPVDGRIEYDGTVQGVQDEQVKIITKSGEIQIPLRSINKAKQII